MAEQKSGIPKASVSSSKSTNPSSPLANELVEIFHNNFPGTPDLPPDLNKAPNTSGSPSQLMKQDKDDDRNPAKLYFQAVKDPAVALRKVEVAGKSLVQDHKDFIREKNRETGKVQARDIYGLRFRRADPITELQVSLDKANDLDLAWSQIEQSRRELVFAQVESAVRVHGFFKAAVLLAKAFCSLGAEVRSRWIAAAALTMLAFLGSWVVVFRITYQLPAEFSWAFAAMMRKHMVPIMVWLTRCIFWGYMALIGAWVLNAGFALLF